MSAFNPDRQMMETLGIDTASIQQRLQLVGFTPQDLPHIANLRLYMEHRVDQLVDHFFENLSQQPEAGFLIDHNILMDEARALKREHLLAMVSGVYDEKYVQQRLRLAHIYSTGELPQRVFLGAMANLLQEIGDMVMHLENDKQKAFKGFNAFRKIATFDISLIIDMLIYERERVIHAQQESIRQLSTPVLELRKRMLLLPLIGGINQDRAAQLTDHLLEAIRKARSQVAVIDLTGTAYLDSMVANRLIETAHGARIMGCRVILSGISAEVATNLVEHNVALDGVNIVGDLRAGIEMAESFFPHSEYATGE